MKKYFIQFAFLIVSLIVTQTAFADVKVKIRQTMSGQSYENTTYIKGKRQRDEQNRGGIETVNLTHCDLKRSVQVMPASQTYTINLWDQAESVEPTTSTTKTQSPTTKGGVITSTITTKDTGERKQMFGYTARHLIITTEMESSPDACSPVKTKMQTDGWYIDAAFALDCSNASANFSMRSEKNGGCRDRFQTKQIGAAKTGYPVYEKMTMFDESGKETFSYVNEVIEFSKTTLDSALFEIPAGFREVKDSTELYASMAKQSSKGNLNNSQDDASSNSNAGMNSNIQNAAKNSSSAKTEVGAKKEGVLRVGLANVKTGAVGEDLNAEELAGAIQNTLSKYLVTPQLEVVQLEGKLTSAIEADAKAKECDYIIYANVAHKKGGGGGMFGKVLGNMANSTVSRIGYGNTASAIARDVAATAIYTAASISSNVKSKDELTLDIKVLATANGYAALSKQYKAKAKSDGEDIISPIIEQAAQAIISAVIQQ